MVSASKPAMAPPAPPVAARAVRPVANVGARISAYLIDSVILLAFILVFFVIGGSVLLFTGDFGEGDPPDSAYYAFLAIFMGGTLIAWSALNLWLLRWRGQSAGMYVVAIRTVGEEATGLTVGQTLRRWFGIHPLLFHPFLLPVWAVFSLLVVSITLSQIVLVVTLALVLLCVIAPLASLVALIADPERRALHDRLARTRVVHIDQP
jgi:uncharacterized RDD family membrane protein YckC